jgi:hypothetical protein
MNSAMSIAASGIAAASASFTASAAKLVNPQSANPQSNGAAAPDTDPSQQIATQAIMMVSYKADLAVFKTAQQMEKSLLDTTA